MEFGTAEKILWEKLGEWKIMALASCEDDYPMVRNISAIMYDGKIWFKTDRNFRKTQQLIANPRVALCWNGVQMEGLAEICGLVVEEPGRVFEKKYREYLWQSYNRYSHEDTEILVCVEPRFVEIWDEDEDRNAFQIFLDFNQETAEKKMYDVEEEG
ncbi:pyridoxamine 5'-phosphate oxidase family protein [Faecalibaculum rodentium]|uniref:pyridoxamine 5'-phosphate oxidase family protein n=1 Tax=Faecalibaculum rodentium TaxID=1702221 RepID=UPI0023F50773|nr:pyridoxamine 5'-phosphate oxidase family protein [Faecalibaculum rodentium]